VLYALFALRWPRTDPFAPLFDVHLHAPQACAPLHLTVCFLSLSLTPAAVFRPGAPPRSQTLARSSCLHLDRPWTVATRARCVSRVPLGTQALASPSVLTPPCHASLQLLDYEHDGEDREVGRQGTGYVARCRMGKCLTSRCPLPQMNHGDDQTEDRGNEHHHEPECVGGAAGYCGSRTRSSGPTRTPLLHAGPRARSTRSPCRPTAPRCAGSPSTMRTRPHEPHHGCCLVPGAVSDTDPGLRQYRSFSAYAHAGLHQQNPARGNGRPAACLLRGCGRCVRHQAAKGAKQQPEQRVMVVLQGGMIARPCKLCNGHRQGCLPGGAVDACLCRRLAC
jgi:hypothetical protein